MHVLVITFDTIVIRAHASIAAWITAFFVLASQPSALKYPDAKCLTYDILAASCDNDDFHAQQIARTEQSSVVSELRNLLVRHRGHSTNAFQASGPIGCSLAALGC